MNSDPFTCREMIIGSFIPSPPPADVRAIILVAGDVTSLRERANIIRWVRKNYKISMNAGLGCFVAGQAPQLNAIKQALAATEGFADVLVVDADAETVAQACFRLDPGPSPDLQLDIVSEKPLSTEIKLLLQRAFNGFSTITLEPLTGGRSPTDGIWRVDASSTDDELRSPFVVKCGPRPSIDMQVRTYRDVVADRVPFRGCAPLCLERSVAGYRKRLSVSRFVERAQRLDEILIQPNCVGPGDIIHSIFSGPLHRWRAQPQMRSLKLFDELLPRGLRKRFGPGLRTTYGRLAAGSVLPPGDLFRAMASVPKRDVPVCRAHDDLNFRNVFVAESGGEIILIDFTRAAVKPLSQDIARMDVGLAFDDELNEQQPIGDEILEAYFSGNLFSISLAHSIKGRSARARLTAIEALRNQMLIESEPLNYDPIIEYKIAIVAGLLYEAKRQTKWSAIAYRCANAIVATL